ncbi:hypothetical protein OIU78_027692 [Salix suchowensis]|nr:hypothetical protein OIU78_027692 [Salix suchowensis]
MPNSNPVKRGQLKVGQASAANLASLLPTGTVLAAQALIPSFTNNGECALANEYLTLGTTTGLPRGNDFWVFNVDRTDGAGLEEEINNKESASSPRAGANEKALIMNLPLGAGLLASLLFMLFPTTRRGIGYGDTPVKSDQKGEEHACSNKESA